MRLMLQGSKPCYKKMEIYPYSALQLSSVKENLRWRHRYRISSVIRQSLFSFQNNPKDLDPSCKTDLDLFDCLGRVKLVL